MANSALHDAVRSSVELAPSTRSKYLRDLDAWIEFAGADPTAWNKRRAAEFEESMRARKLSKESMNRVMNSLRYASRHRAFIVGDKAADFFDEEPIRVLTKDEVTALIKTCELGHGDDLRDLAVIVLGLETGMRKPTMASTVIEHIYLKTDTPSAAVFVRSKDAEDDRVAVPLSDAAVAAIRPWLSYLAHLGVTRGPLFRGLIRREGGFRPMNPSLSTSMLQKIVGTRGEQAGIGMINPDLLRHTFTQWRSEAGLTPMEYLPEQNPGQKTRRATPSWLNELMGVV